MNNEEVYQKAVAPLKKELEMLDWGGDPKRSWDRKWQIYEEMNREFDKAGLKTNE